VISVTGGGASVSPATVSKPTAAACSVLIVFVAMDVVSVLFFWLCLCGACSVVFVSERMMDWGGEL
jgi:hypothetical protein